MRIALFFICFLLNSFGIANAHAGVPEAKWSTVESRLKKNGFEKRFIQILKDCYEPDEFKNVLELNVDLFLKKTDHHGVQVTEDAVDHVRDFTKKNAEALTLAEKKYGVPASVVASLLWIESRFGKSNGRFHVLSVFAHLTQADRPDVIRYLKGAGAKRFVKNPPRNSLAKISSRAKKKALWAIGELRKLQKIGVADPDLVRRLRGSFAGAFGIPQFLPSSYLIWARPLEAGATPDLNRTGDAIQSVAFFLHDNGWRNHRPKTHARSLMNYNASKDYANAILKLSKLVSTGKAAANRKPSGNPSDH